MSYGLDDVTLKILKNTSVITDIFAPTLLSIFCAKQTRTQYLQCGEILGIICAKHAAHIRQE